jgi:hypothetical protein
MEQAVRAREPRRKVLIDARLRHDGGWADARILDLSARGLMARSQYAPARGTYVEICRGAHRVVARVVWVRDGRFGARSRDPIVIDGLSDGVDPALPAPANDRRSARREPPPAERLGRSRRWSRRGEFVAVVTLACAAAFLAVEAVRTTLSKPLNTIEAQLGG